MIYRSQAFSGSYSFDYSLTHSLPPSLPSPVRYARPATRRKTEKGRQLADGRGGMGRGAKSYDPEKAKKGIDNQFC
jgi:hypothetical protein